jgi:short subunit dehydrogenase-like uncharacterized protein
VPSAASTRDYDVLLYGAGGFTGRQTVAYFAAHAPPGLRWAMAGPRRQTLEAARAAAGARLEDGELIVAPSQDQAAVDSAVQRARIVLSTAGPFARYGTPVVDACVRLRTHYVDITGETPWMRDIASRYHDRAAADGTRIIPACGFDSVPSDLGQHLMARHVRDAMGVACAEVRACFRFSGGVNGGTVASLLNMLDMPSNRHPASSGRRDPRIRLVRAPRYDTECGAWIGPFVMAPTNTHVVRRSLTLAEQWHAPEAAFVYQEAMRYDAPFARVRAVAASAALGLLLAALKQPLTRRLVQPLLPKPGTGPSEQTMNAGWFTCDLLGIAVDGRQARGLIHYDGDPGNRATTVLVCESALALALDADALPGGRDRGGVLTPATGLGDVLVARLRRAGVVIDIPSTERRDG